MSDSCNPMDCSPPGASVPGILQARILEPLFLEFSRQGYWSLCSWNSPGKNIGAGCHYPLQGVFLWGLNPCLLRLLDWQAGSLPLCHPGGLMLTQSAFISSYLHGQLAPNPSGYLWEMVCIWNSEWSHSRSEGADRLFSNSRVGLKVTSEGVDSLALRPSQLTLKMHSGGELQALAVRHLGVCAQLLSCVRVFVTPPGSSVHSIL